jgi:hypothetical protein
MARKPTDYVQFKLRIREALRRKLEREAEKKKISTNAEAVERIEYTFAEEEEREAHLKELEEHSEEINRQQQEYYEYEAKKEAEFEAALRDSKLLRRLIGGDENAEVLNLVFLGLANNPNWVACPESRKALADKVHNFLISTDFKKGGGK